MQSKRIIYSFKIIILTILTFVILQEIGNDGSQETLRLYGLLCLAHFVLMFIFAKQMTGKYLTLFACYLTAFFTFQCGQYVLYAFNITYNYFYIESYDRNVVIQSVLYSVLCNGAAFLAAPFCITYKENGFFKKLNGLDNHSVLFNAKTLFFFLTIVEIPYCLIRFYVVLQSGYTGVRNFEASLPHVLSLIDMLYVPSILLCTIYEKTNKKKYAVIIVIWSVINALNGDRSSGIGGLIIFGILYLNGILQIDKSKNNKKRYITFGIIAVFAMYLIMFAYNFRNQRDANFFESIGTVIVDVLGELGFSFFPLVLTMRICPANTGYLYGKSIIASFIAAFFPSSFDFLGVFNRFFSMSTEGRSWLDQYYNYTFGLGYSLNAESYSNFGMLGFVWIYVLSILVSKVLAEPDFNQTNNKFSQYASLSLLFVLFTMPRRSCYYLFNFYFYYIIVIGVVLLSLSNKRRT